MQGSVLGPSPFRSHANDIPRLALISYNYKDVCEFSKFIFHANTPQSLAYSPDSLSLKPHPVVTFSVSLSLSLFL